MITGLAWLGWRLGTRRGYGPRLRMALLFLGVLLITCVALLGASVPGAMQSRQERAESLRLDYGKSDSGVRGLTSESGRRWGGLEVERTLIAVEDPGGTSIDMPGVPALPGEGEAYVSPELASGAKDDPILRALLSEYRVVGTIEPDGLVSPVEFRAVIGVPAETRFLEPVVGVGAATPPDVNRFVNRHLSVLLMVLVSIPAVALVVLCARLGSRQRAGRIAALRRLGLSRRRVRLVMATETVLVAVPAAFAGASLYLLALVAFDRVPGTQFGFHRSDVLLPLPGIVGVVLGVLLVVVASAIAGVTMDEALPGSDSRRSRRSWWVGAVGIVVGFLGLALWPRLPEGGTGPVVAWLSMGLVTAGFALCSHWLVAGASRMAAGRVRSGGWLVGLRLNCAEPGTSSRLTALIAVLIIATTTGVNYMAIFTSGLNARVAPDAAASVIIRVSDYGRVLTTERVAGTEGVDAAVPVAGLEGDRDTILAVAAPCSDLRAITDRPIDGCRDDKARWLSKSGAPAPLSSSRQVETASDGMLRLPPKAATLAVGSTDLLDGYLHLSTLGETADSGSMSHYFVRVKAAEYAETLARLSSQAPSAGFDFGDKVALDSDTQEYVGHMTWLTIAAGLSAFLAWLGLVISISGETEARRDQLRGLRLIGAPDRDLGRAHFATVMVPLATVAAGATVLAKLVNLGISIGDDRKALPYSFFLALVLLAVAIAVLTALATLPSALRRPAIARDAQPG